jgi:antitoxin ParD1/3/4
MIALIWRITATIPLRRGTGRETGHGAEEARLRVPPGRGLGLRIDRPEGCWSLWPAPTIEAKTGSRAWLTLGSGMHAPRTMSVSITPDLAAFARAWVASGRYRSASKVVRATLRLLEGEEHRRWKPRPPYEPRKDCPACPSVLPPTTP